MSKELTEQWRNGTLKFGYYYVKNRDGEVFTLAISGGFIDENLFQHIVEVFAPVPTYDQFSQMVKKVERLERKLTEANQTIKDIREVIRTGEFPCDACGYSMECEGCWCGDIADSYLEKWGEK